MQPLFGHFLRNDGSTTRTFYSPWFATPSDRCCFGAEAFRIAGTGSPKLEIKFQSKNVEDDSSSPVTLNDGANDYKIDLTAVDTPVMEEVDGCLEQVRFKYTVSGTDVSINFRMLPPSPVPN